MSYFYVKSSFGTRTTGGGLTQQTGAFSALGASNVYATVGAAITDGATSGDFICVSTSHSEGASAMTYIGPGSGGPVLMVSVSDSACDTYTKATAKQIGGNSTGSTTFNGRWALFGIWCTGGRTAFSLGIYASVYAYECTAEVVGSGTYTVMSAGADGARIIAVNCDLIGNGSSIAISSNNSKINLYGGSLSSVGSVFGGGNSEGGANVEVNGVDLSGASDTVLLPSWGANPVDAAFVTLYNCKLNASWSFTDETITRSGNRLLAVGCSPTSVGAEYAFFSQAFGGKAESTTSIYRDASTAFPSTQKISIKVTVTSDASVAAPFFFTFPSRYVDFSAAGEDVVTLYLISSVTLTNQDVWVEFLYPDGTTKNIMNQISTRAANILGSGTGLTTNTESWTGRTTENRYEISVDTSGDAGSASVPEIRVSIAKEGTYHFCPTVGLS